MGGCAEREKCVHGQEGAAVADVIADDGVRRAHPKSGARLHPPRLDEGSCRSQTRFAGYWPENIGWAGHFPENADVKENEIYILESIHAGLHDGARM